MPERHSAAEPAPSLVGRVYLRATVPCLGQRRLEGYPSEAKRAPGRARRLAGDNPLQDLSFQHPFQPPANKTHKEVILGPRREITSEVFLAFRTGENFPYLSNSCLRMKKTAHSFILRHENPTIHGYTCLKMEKPATFFILRHKNESGSGRIGRIVLSARGGEEFISRPE